MKLRPLTASEVEFVPETAGPGHVPITHGESRMKLRSLTASEIEFELDTEPELEPFEGNVLASGDDEADREVEEGIRERLQCGDISAWCILVVHAKWKGYEGVASLGGYSFPAGQTGDQNREYAAEDFEYLKAEALADLNRTLQARAEIPKEIRALAR